MKFILFILFLSLSKSKIITTRVLLNKCVGIFEFSNTFCKKYEKKYKTPIPDMNYKNVHLRYNEQLLTIYDKMNNYKKASGPNSKIFIEEIPSHLTDFIIIKSHAGLEWIEIDFQKKYNNLIETWNKK
jgi:hypothetical protein